MKNKPVTNRKAATRRTFFLKAGTALTLPLAACASAPQDGREDLIDDAPADHAKAIRRLQQALAREINEGTRRAAELFAAGKLPAELDNVTRLLPADFGEHDVVEIAANGLTAHATIHCTVETQVPIVAEGTLIEMARLQGEGFVRAKGCRMLDMVCVREGGSWKIKVLAMREA